MCGILGFAGRPPGGKPLRWRQAMESIRHRGPDASGEYFAQLPDNRGTACTESDIHSGFEAGPGVAVGHRRLSIIDTSSASNQPFVKDQFALVFNGEIYNYIELREELKAAGHSFSTCGDTEVLLVAYSQWGRDCLSRFRGMFAFAIHDSNRNLLWLARDRFGIKPLYFLNTDRGIAFASEPGTILALLDLKPRPDWKSIFHLVCHRSYEFGHESFFKDIQQLSAGEDLLIRLPGLESDLRTWYSLPEYIGSAEQLPDNDDTIELFRHVFDEAVRVHIRSDVPLGLGLSGGIDSSCLAGTLTANHPELADSHNGPLRAFSAVFEDSDANETKHLDALVSTYSIDSHRVSPSTDTMNSTLRFLGEIHGGPISKPSIVVQHSVMQLAREHGITVMLTGQGGDELLGGYPIFIMLNLLRLFKQNPLAGVKSAAEVWFKGDPEIKPLLWTFLRRRGKRRGTGALASALDPERFEQYRCMPHPVPWTTDPQAFRCRQLQVFPIPGLCKNEDRNSMAFSLESRVPYLDHEIIELALRLPPEMLFKNGLAKYALRRSMNGRVPESVLRRRTKLGFAAPEHRWLGRMTWREFRGRLTAQQSLASLFAGNEDLLSEQFWPRLSNDSRFLLMSMDAWLTGVICD